MGNTVSNICIGNVGSGAAPPAAHAPTHHIGGSDPLVFEQIQNVGAAGEVFTSDGAGGGVWGSINIGNTIQVATLADRDAIPVADRDNLIVKVLDSDGLGTPKNYGWDSVSMTWIELADRVNVGKLCDLDLDTCVTVENSPGSDEDLIQGMAAGARRFVFSQTASTIYDTNIIPAFYSEGGAGSGDQIIRLGDNPLDIMTLKMNQVGLNAEPEIVAKTVSSDTTRSTLEISENDASLEMLFPSGRYGWVGASKNILNFPLNGTGTFFALADPGASMPDHFAYNFSGDFSALNPQYDLQSLVGIVNQTTGEEVGFRFLQNTDGSGEQNFSIRSQASTLNLYASIEADTSTTGSQMQLLFSSSAGASDITLEPLLISLSSAEYRFTTKPSGTDDTATYAPTDLFYPGPLGQLYVAPIDAIIPKPVTANLTTNSTLEIGGKYTYDVTAGGFDLTLPATANLRDTIEICPRAGDCSVSPITINGGTSSIDVLNGGAELTYDGVQWRVNFQVWPIV